MAITVYGVAGSMDVPAWSQLIQDVGDAGAGAQVMTGLKVTAATGTRIVNVAAGRALLAGTSANNLASATATFTANSSGQPRIDVVALRVDTAGTMAGAGTLTVVTGVPAATPIAPVWGTSPGLEYNPGGIVTIPLAQVTIASGATQLTSGNITDVRQLTAVAATWTALTLSNSWAAIGTTPPAVRVLNGVAYLRGRLAGGTATDGFLMATLPAGTRPPVDLIDIPAMRGTTTASAWKVTIRANGRIEPVALAGNSFVSLNGISYPIG